MAARKITPERSEQRKKLLELLQDAGINDVAGVEDLFKETVGTVLENGLDGELESELFYSKYDYRNKDKSSACHQRHNQFDKVFQLHLLFGIDTMRPVDIIKASVCSTSGKY